MYNKLCLFNTKT